MITNELYISNLKCGGCANTIAKNLNKIKGVGSVHVNLDSSSVTVEIEDKEVSHEVKDRLKAMGYPPLDASNTLINKGKSYVSCMLGRISE
jgi:copper chaperone CopZ